MGSIYNRSIVKQRGNLAGCVAGLIVRVTGCVTSVIGLRNMRNWVVRVTGACFLYFLLMYARMEADEKKEFNDYLSRTFPEELKRTRSAVIHRSLAQRIINYLKGNLEEDKAFRHFVKKLDLACLIYQLQECLMFW